MALPKLRTHTDAVIALLESFDLAVGDAIAPDVPPPYVVVYPIPGGKALGTLAAPSDDAELIFQVTCVGTTREQAQWLSDAVLVWLHGPLEVDDRKIARIGLESHAGVMRDDQQTPPVFMAAPRFRVTSTPA